MLRIPPSICGLGTTAEARWRSLRSLRKTYVRAWVLRHREARIRLTKPAYPVLPSANWTASALRTSGFSLLYGPRPHAPLSTLNLHPRGRRSITRGESGWLYPPSCRTLTDCLARSWPDAPRSPSALGFRPLPQTTRHWLFFDRGSGRRAARRHHPESAGELPAARGGFLHLPGRRPPTHQHASGQADHRTHPASVEVTVRRRSLALRPRPAPLRSATTLIAITQPRPRLRAYGATPSPAVQPIRGTRRLPFAISR